MIDLSACMGDALYRLGFQGWDDLQAENTWVTGTELFQWSDEAAKRVAYQCGAFITTDTSMTAIAGTAVYALPASHVFTLAAWLNNKALRITPVRELWALDHTWSASSGPATRCSLDAGNVGTLTLYPTPTIGGTLGQVLQIFAPQIWEGGHTIQLPTVFADYFSYAMLAGARGKESDAAMPEMAEHFTERCKLYELVMQHLYGSVERRV